MIYFIQSEVGGPIKIGYTHSRDTVDRRMAQLQAAHPYKLVCLATMNGSIFIERRLHEMFHKHRLLGEWFENTDELQEFIRNIDTFDAKTLMNYAPGVKKAVVRFDVHAFVEELYIAACKNNWDFETCVESFKREFYRHGYTVTATLKQVEWFRSEHRTRFEEKLDRPGLQL